MNKKSLEDVIRDVHNRNKHKPSPLSFMNSENSSIGYAPQQVTPKTEDNIRSRLISGFKPPNDTFR